MLLEQSLDGWGEIIGELGRLGRKLSLHNGAINIFQLRDLLQGIVLGIVLQDLIERVAHQEGVLKIGELAKFVQLLPTLYLII